MALPLHIFWAAASQTTISSTVGAAANAPIPLVNGTIIPNIITGTSQVQYDFGINIARTIALTSANDYSGTTFILSGLNNLGVLQTETIAAGPNNDTVYSVNHYRVLYSVIPDTDVADMDIGTGGGSTNIIALNTFANESSFSFGWELTGTWTADTAIVPYQVFGNLVEWTNGFLGPAPHYPAVGYYIFPDSFVIGDSGNIFYQDNLTRSGVFTAVADPSADFDTNTGSFNWIILQQGSTNA